MAFLYSHWRELSLPTRAVIAKAFGIGKRFPTHVRDNVVIEDGYDIKEIETALNILAIQEYTALLNETDLNILWTALVDRAEGRQVGQVELVPIVSETVLEITPETTIIQEKDTLVVRETKPKKTKKKK